MNRSDDELDNLLRDHFAGELSPMRGQAGRAFAREVLTPMRRHLAHDQWRQRLSTARQATFTLAASTALGFFIPQWLAAGPGAPSGDAAVSTAFESPTFVDYKRLAIPGQTEDEPATLPTHPAN